ncbi:hypothetical protein EON62_02600 [archaeon]|nr:MAG: hypothetical protein EON62_02600 [archaeon]
MSTAGGVPDGAGESRFPPEAAGARTTVPASLQQHGRDAAHSMPPRPADHSASGVMSAVQARQGGGSRSPGTVTATLNPQTSRFAHPVAGDTTVTSQPHAPAHVARPGGVASYTTTVSAAPGAAPATSAGVPAPNGSAVTNAKTLQLKAIAALRAVQARTAASAASIAPPTAPTPPTPPSVGAHPVPGPRARVNVPVPTHHASAPLAVPGPVRRGGAATAHTAVATPSAAGAGTTRRDGAPDRAAAAPSRSAMPGWPTIVVSKSGYTPTQSSEGDGTVGVCPRMCSLEEISIRSEQQQVHVFEQPVGDATFMDLAVKLYRRSAAGSDEQTDVTIVRPPLVLLRTLDYLVHNVLDADAGEPDPRFVEEDGITPRPPTVHEIQAFVWNRSRAIARDLVSQNYGESHRNDAVAMEIHERMVCARASVCVCAHHLQCAVHCVSPMRATCAPVPTCRSAFIFCFSTSAWMRKTSASASRNKIWNS